MFLSALLTLALGQCGPYTRSRVSDLNPNSPCLRWRENSLLDWRINDQGNPENTGDAEFVAADRALATWQNELTTCGSLTLTAGARTSSRLAQFDKTSGTNQNVVLWRFTRCAQIVPSSDLCWINGNCGNQYDCWEHSAGALALTTTSFEPSTGLILDSDIELNTPGFLFTTVDSPVCVSPNFSVACVATDIQNALTHELGHALGLGHSCLSGSTMSAGTAPGELSKRVLDPGSKLAMCEIYPKGKASTDCAADAGGGAGGGTAGGSGGGSDAGSAGGTGGSGGGAAGGGSAGGGSAGGAGGGAASARGCGCTGGADGALAFALLGILRWVIRRSNPRQGLPE